MAAQYWVGDFYVDLTRNQITQQMQSKTIPPKALAVLTCLARNANKVVSHDELLSEVWPDTVVTPNTLQRSIAQLRKALGEDSQSYIKTHAKQGYSLECEVRWQGELDEAPQTEPDVLAQVDAAAADASLPDDQEPVIDEPQVAEVVQPETESRTSTRPSRSRLHLGLIAIGILILSVAGVNFLSPPQPLKLSFGELRFLTATDHKEIGGIYSPNGEYIVFLRYSRKPCFNSNVWAKNIKTQQETRLTNATGSYSGISFSPNGKELVFIETNSCDKPITQKQCYQLVTLDFEKALNAPQSPSVLMECKNSRIINPKWLNDNNVALLQNESNRWKLANYSVADNKSTVIYSLEDGSVFDYDYSVKADLISVISAHSDGQNYVEILEPSGRVISSHQIEYLEEIANLRPIYPNFTSTGDQLIFSTGRQLFTLSFDGEITKISLPIDESMGSPIFHPDGKRMLMIKGRYDSDIATVSLSQLTQAPTDQAQDIHSIIARSTQSDEDAAYQPNGELIVFKSRRSGEDQLWISDGNSPQQLTHFPMDTRIDGLDWAADGQSLLVNANYVLTRVNLDSSLIRFAFDYPVVRLFQWNSLDNTALLLARIKGVPTFVELDLQSAQFRVITDKTVNWALKTDDGRLIYTDQLDRFWQPGPAEDQLIEPLESQGSNRRFVTKGNVVYGVNEQLQLWSYSLDTDAFEILGNVPENMDYLTDIQQAELLMTMRITAKKEVAELILAD